MRLFSRTKPSRVIVVLDCADRGVDTPGSFEGCRDSANANVLNWLLYCQSLARTHDEEVILVLPESEKDRLSSQNKLDSLSIVWTSDHDIQTLPPAMHGEDALIINGMTTPFLPSSSAREDTRPPNIDALVFNDQSSTDSQRYKEYVLVDDNNRIKQFVRRHHDSDRAPIEPDRTVSCIRCSDKFAHFVVGQVFSLGWGMDAIGAMTSRLRVGWSDSAPKEGIHRTPVARAGSVAASVANVEKTIDPMWENATSSSLVDQGDPYTTVKRSLDIAASSLTLLVLSPLILAVSLLIKATSKGPVFYKDRRQGLNGREFNCIKFRTMITGADALQAELRAQNEVDGPQFKIAKDPRITTVGDWLRKTCVDEIPQFFNVLRGDMSLVGPRPSPDRENQLCPGWRRARLSTPPGITGLWQVLRTRNESSSDFQQWIYYDLEYVRHRSLWLDIQLLVYTPISLFAPSLLNRFARSLGARGICKQSPRIRAGEQQIDRTKSGPKHIASRKHGKPSKKSRIKESV